MMAFFTYLLSCGMARCGHTENLELRLAEHQAGTCGGYTATRLPVALVWSQDFSIREEALVSARQIKGWSRAKKEALIAGDWKEINRLGRGKHRHERAIIIHPSTSEAALPTLRTNGGGDLTIAHRHSSPSVPPERKREALKSKDE